LGGLTYVTLGRWGQPLTNSLFLSGGLLLALFAWIERRVPEPMMDPHLFRIRMFWAGNLAMFLNALSRGATMFIMSWYFQAVVGDQPLVAGLKMLPMAVSMALSAPLAGLLTDRLGSRYLPTLGLIGTTASMVW